MSTVSHELYQCTEWLAVRIPKKKSFWCSIPIMLKKSNLHRNLKLEISVAIFSLVHFCICIFADFLIFIIGSFFLSSESNFYCYAVIQIEHFFLKNKLKNKGNVWPHVIAKQNLLGCDSQIIVFFSYVEYEL